MSAWVVVGDPGMVCTLPDRKLGWKRNVSKIQVSPGLAAAVLLRHSRARAGLTQKERT